jgi:hypothetical protein
MDSQDINRQANRKALTSTKAGRRLMGLMVVFNSGDLERLRAFIEQNTGAEALEQHSPEEWAQQLGHIYDATGGMRVQQVIAADEYKVVVLMQAHTNDALYMAQMAVSDEYPYKIAEFIHQPARMGS